MKNLKTLGVLVAVCGTLGSCGIPMAAVRSAQNTVKSVPTATQRTAKNTLQALVTTATNPLGY